MPSTSIVCSASSAGWGPTSGRSPDGTCLSQRCRQRARADGHFLPSWPSPHRDYAHSPPRTRGDVTYVGRRRQPPPRAPEAPPARPARGVHIGVGLEKEAVHRPRIRKNLTRSSPAACARATRASRARAPPWSASSWITTERSSAQSTSKLDRPCRTSARARRDAGRSPPRPHRAPPGLRQPCARALNSSCG